MKQYLITFELCGVQLIEFAFNSKHRKNSRANINYGLKLFENTHGHFLRQCITRVIYIEEIKEGAK
jgi:hypothetical protein